MAFLDTMPEVLVNSVLCGARKDYFQHDQPRCDAKPSPQTRRSVQWPHPYSLAPTKEKKSAEKELRLVLTALQDRRTWY
jgi:hypothetical protein